MRVQLMVFAAISQIVLVGCAASASRLDRTKLLVGAWCYQPSAYDDEHVRMIAECGVDYISGVQTSERAVLDRFAKYGVGVFLHEMPCYWWGGDGSAAGQMRQKCPADKNRERLEAYVKDIDHPAIWGFQLCDEPSAKDMQYLGEICAQVSALVPQVQPFANLYPNYASYSQNTDREEANQLGVSSYREYIATYCRTVPLDFISYDFYVYTQDRARRPSLVRQMYDNFNVVADACRRTGRSFWYSPQVNSHPAAKIEPTTVNRLRFQAYTAMAFGAEAVQWACWMPGWWDNNVLTESGAKTEQYDRLRKVAAELHRFGPKYMRFRNVATHYVGFAHDPEMDRLGVPFLDELDTGAFRCVRTLGRTPVLVGEMVPRGKDSGLRALFVICSGDMFDTAPATQQVTFRLPEGRDVRIQGVDGEIVPTRGPDGAYAFPLAENAAALLISGPSKAECPN